MSFLGEIKRRKVFQVAAVYLVVAWLIMQVVDVVSGPLLLPDIFARIVILVLAIGFPIALVLSWAFDLTPRGVVRDSGDAVVSGRRIESVLVGLLVLAVGFIFVDNYVFDSAPDTAQPANEPLESGPTVAVEEQSTLLPNSVAVLPFENLSPDPDNAYFALGVHEQVLNELAKISDLNVIARTTMMRYADDPPPIPEIAETLRVELVMEGSVRYAGDQVRVTAQLIDGDEGTHVWTEDYTADISDVFGIQSDIATQIAMALEARILPEERQSIQRQPTESAEAIRLYYQARTPIQNFSGGSLVGVHEFLDPAIEIDPYFALPYALKAVSYAFSIGRRDSPFSVPYRDALARGFAEKALELDSQVGLAHLALGRVHLYNAQAESAIEEHRRAFELSPNDFDILDEYARVLSLTRQHEQAIDFADRAAELGPAGFLLAVVNLRAGLHTEAAEAARERIENRPYEQGLFMRLWLIAIELAAGNVSGARAEVDEVENLLIAEDDLRVNAQNLSRLAYFQGRLGNADKASSYFAEFESLALNGMADETDWTLAYLAIGDEEQALEALRRLSGSHQPMNAQSIYIVDNDYADPVLGLPEFVEVRSGLGFRDL